MEKYQEVAFYLTDDGYIMGDVINQDGKIIKKADQPIPSNYYLKTIQKTYKPKVNKTHDSVGVQVGKSSNFSDKEGIDLINDLHKKYCGKKIYVPYLLEK